MAENGIAKANSKSKIIALATVCTALILVAAFVGIYYLVPSNSKPATTNVVPRFSDGAWLNYAIVSYDSAGDTRGRGVVNSTITSGIYAEKPCWIYSGNVTFTYNNGSIFNDLMTDYLDKSTCSTLQTSMLRYVDGELAINETLGPQDEGYHDDLTFLGNLNVKATNQNVSVPAGTFQSTVREGPDADSVLTLTIWQNEDVPAWGEVKSQYSRDGHVLCVYTLESYGY